MKGVGGMEMRPILEENNEEWVILFSIQIQCRALY